MPAPDRGGNAIAGFIRLARPKQWIKNLLVVAAPLAAGVLFSLSVLGWTALAFILFSMAASSVYMINDVLDAAADRAHPRKQNRPIAAGIVTPRAALICAAVLAALSVGAPAILGNGKLAMIIAGYLVLQAAYLMRLKHEPVLDIACVASGFLLRAIAGGAASGVPISKSFLIVVSFGALFMVVGKRYSELASQHETTTTQTRKMLTKYTASYLRMLLAISMSITLVSYTLWAFEMDKIGTGSIPFAALSCVPFTLALLRYARDVDAAVAEAPEDVVLADATLLILGLLWVAAFVAQVLQR